MTDSASTSDTRETPEEPQVHQQTNEASASEDFSEVWSLMQAIEEACASIILGQEQVIRLCIIAILNGQHALLEGVPGVGKTLLIRTLAKLMKVPFNRIQFTPDLMPADITGTNIYNIQTNSFTLMKGPIFTGFLLADEINRAPAKTQSALLQAMQERCVTIDRESYDLPEFFTVFATQNPIDQEGTYPLPEAQLDRFMLKIDMAPLDEENELKLARQSLGDDAPERRLAGEELKPILDPETLRKVRQQLQHVRIEDPILDYAVKIVRHTRDSQYLLSGASPRATQSLLWGARTMAVMEKRDFVIPEDIRNLCIPTLQHRLILRPEYEIEGATTIEILNEIIEEVAVPR